MIYYSFPLKRNFKDNRIFHFTMSVLTVMLARFGRFEVKTLKEKQGRNPQTGEGCFIPQPGSRCIIIYQSLLTANNP